MSPPFKTHELLAHDGVTHGFFGRNGGVSGGVYASLNVGQGSKDAPENIVKNRAHIARAIGCAPSHLLSLSQIHSPKVLTIDAPFEGPLPEADSMVTRVKGIALSSLSADCGPVLLSDPEAGVIGACHAGWRGALAGVTSATIEAMENLGASRESICAVLGPCISQKNYEVGDEFRDNILALNEADDCFFEDGPSGKPHFDLKAYILARLRAHGVTRIAALSDCTYGQPQDYFSYRYNTHQGVSGYGRNISVIILRE